MMTLLYILLALYFFTCIFLYKVYHSLPAAEFKRRARMGDKKFHALHSVSAYGDSFDLLLWLTGTASGAVLFIWSARAKWWLVVAIVVVTAWLMVWGRASAEGRGGRVAAVLAPVFARLMSYLGPVLDRFVSILEPLRSVHVHTGLYEKEDLLELLNKQNGQVDNRIPEGDLNIAFNALTFGDKTVGSIMTPRRQVKMVNATDTAGPMLMDELHKTGFSRFPVVKDSPKAASPQFAGTLYLNDLVGYEGNGKIKDLAKKSRRSSGVSDSSLMCPMSSVSASCL